MAVKVFKKVSSRKVAPLVVPDDVDGLGRQKCPVEIFRARRGFEQCKLNFLTTVADKLDGQTSTSGQFYESFCYPGMTTRTAKSAKDSLALDQTCHVSIRQKGKPRKFRPRKIIRQLVGKGKKKVKSASE